MSVKSILDKLSDFYGVMLREVNSDVGDQVLRLGPRNRLVAIVLGLLSTEYHIVDGKIRFDQTGLKDVLVERYNCSSSLIDALIAACEIENGNLETIGRLVHRMTGDNFVFIDSSDQRLPRVIPGLTDRRYIVVVTKTINDRIDDMVVAIAQPDCYAAITARVPVDYTVYDSLVKMVNFLPYRGVLRAANDNQVKLVMNLDEAELRKLRDHFKGLSIDHEPRSSSSNHPIGRAFEMCFNKEIDYLIERQTTSAMTVWELGGRVSSRVDNSVNVAPVILSARDEYRVYNDMVGCMKKLEDIVSAKSRFDYSKAVGLIQQISRSNREARTTLEKVINEDSQSTIRQALRAGLGNIVDFDPVVNGHVPRSFTCDVLVLRHCVYGVKPYDLLDLMHYGKIKTAYVTMHYFPEMELADEAYCYITTHRMYKMGDDIFGTFTGDDANQYRTDLNTYLAWTQLPADLNHSGCTFFIERIKTVGSLTCFKISNCGKVEPSHDVRPLYDNCDMIVIGHVPFNHTYRKRVLRIDSDSLSRMQDTVKSMKNEVNVVSVNSIVQSSVRRLKVNKNIVIDPTLDRLTSDDTTLLRDYLIRYHKYTVEAMDQFGRDEFVDYSLTAAAVGAVVPVIANIYGVTPGLVWAKLREMFSDCYQKLVLIHRYYRTRNQPPPPKTIASVIGERVKRLMSYFSTAEVEEEPVPVPLFERLRVLFVESLITAFSMWVSYRLLFILRDFYYWTFDRERYNRMKLTSTYVRPLDITKNVLWPGFCGFATSIGFSTIGVTNLGILAGAGTVVGVEAVSHMVKSLRKRQPNDSSIVEDVRTYEKWIESYPGDNIGPVVFNTSNIVARRFSTYADKAGRAGLKSSYEFKFPPNQLVQFENLIRSAVLNQEHLSSDRPFEGHMARMGDSNGSVSGQGTPGLFRRTLNNAFGVCRDAAGAAVFSCGLCYMVNASSSFDDYARFCFTGGIIGGFVSASYRASPRLDLSGSVRKNQRRNDYQFPNASDILGSKSPIPRSVVQEAVPSDTDYFSDNSLDGLNGVSSTSIDQSSRASDYTSTSMASRENDFPDVKPKQSRDFGQTCVKVVDDSKVESSVPNTEPTKANIRVTVKSPGGTTESQEVRTISVGEGETVDEVLKREVAKKAQEVGGKVGADVKVVSHHTSSFSELSSDSDDPKTSVVTPTFEFCVDELFSKPRSRSLTGGSPKKSFRVDSSCTDYTKTFFEGVKERKVGRKRADDLFGKRKFQAAKTVKGLLDIKEKVRDAPVGMNSLRATEIFGVVDRSLRVSNHCNYAVGLLSAIVAYYNTDNNKLIVLVNLFGRTNVHVARQLYSVCATMNIVVVDDGFPTRDQQELSSWRFVNMEYAVAKCMDSAVRGGLRNDVVFIVSKYPNADADLLIKTVTERSIVLKFGDKVEGANKFSTTIPYVRAPAHSNVPVPPIFNRVPVNDECVDCAIVSKIMYRSRLGGGFHYTVLKKCPRYCRSSPRVTYSSRDSRSSQQSRGSNELRMESQIDVLKQSMRARIDAYALIKQFRLDYYGPRPEDATSLRKPKFHNLYPRPYIPPIIFQSNFSQMYDCVADYIMRECGLLYTTVCKLNEAYEMYTDPNRKSKEERPFIYLTDANNHEFFINLENRTLEHYSSVLRKAPSTKSEARKFITNDNLRYFYSYHVIETNNRRDVPITCRLERVVHFDGIAGCGKTTKIKQLIEMYGAKNIKILAQSKSGAEEIGFGAQTVGSLIQNVVRYDGTGCDVLIIDEAAMMHPGQIILAASIVHARVVVMFGDSRQIPYIERDAVYVREVPGFPLPLEVYNMNHTYRCPLDAAKAAATVYDRHITTSNPINTSMSFMGGVDLVNFKVNFVPDLVITMTQLEKDEIQRVRPEWKVRTVHEAQGMSVPYVVFLRLQVKDITLYLPDTNGRMNSHTLVAITRHTKKFVYATVSALSCDTFATMLLNNSLAGSASYCAKEDDYYAEVMKVLPTQSNFRGKPVFNCSRATNMYGVSYAFNEKNYKQEIKNLGQKVAQMANLHDVWLTKDSDVVYHQQSTEWSTTGVSGIISANENFRMVHVVSGDRPTVQYEQRTKTEGINDCWFKALEPEFARLGYFTLSQAVRALGIPFGTKPYFKAVVRFMAWRMGTELTTLPCSKAKSTSFKYRERQGVDEENVCDDCVGLKLSIVDGVGHIERVAIDDATHVMCMPKGLPTHPYKVDEAFDRYYDVCCGRSYEEFKLKKLQFAKTNDMTYETVDTDVVEVPRDEFYNRVMEAFSANRLGDTHREGFRYEVANYPALPELEYSLPIVTIDSVYAAQVQYDDVTNGISSVDPTWDKLVNMRAPVELNNSNMSVPLMQLINKGVKCEQRNPSMLRTNWYPNNTNNLDELLEAANERNWNAPSLQAAVSSEIYANNMLNKFFRVFCVDNAKEICEKFRERPLGYNRKYVEEWIEHLPSDKKQKYSSVDLFLNDLTTLRYEASLKSANKSVGEGTIGTKIPKGQVINAMNKEISFYFSPMIREATDRLRSILKDEILLIIGHNEDYASEFVNHHIQGEDSVVYYECDFSAFDKSVYRPHLMLFIELLRTLGATDEDLILWEQYHDYCQSVTRHGASWYVSFQTKSGDPATAIANTFYNMVSLIDLYVRVDAFAAMFMGDDSLIFGRKRVRIDRFDAEMALTHGFSAKLLQPEVAQFCGGLLVDLGNHYRFMTDPVKRFEKLGCQDNPDLVTLASKFISLGDRLKNYKNYAVSAAVAEHVAVRYNCKISPIIMVEFLRHISTCFSDYMRLFGVNVKDLKVESLLQQARERVYKNDVLV